MRELLSELFLGYEGWIFLSSVIVFTLAALGIGSAVIILRDEVARRLRWAKLDRQLKRRFPHLS